MRIAVTYENGQIFQHFGHTEQFKVYDLEDNKIVNTQVVDTNGQGHGALAGFLNSTDIDVLMWWHRWRSTGCTCCCGNKTVRWSIR